MKDVSNVVACVVDYGNFISLARKLGEVYKKVYYYCPHETEYRNINDSVFGLGFEEIEIVEELFTIELISKIDLFIFPDIGFAELQKYFVSLGKAVWGAKETTNLELSRSNFMKFVEDIGLPVPEHVVVKGLSKLKDVLEKEEDKWIKLDLYRDNMETWHHIDYEHSQPMLRYLASIFGGLTEKVTFIIQDSIPNAQELGYDGYCVDGQFPNLSFQGYEKKNELYIGSALTKEDLPEQVLIVNEAIADYWKECQYRNFFASEIRDEFFIDPTPRMAGQTQEQLIENCTNLAEIIWIGAHGILVEPEFQAQYAVSATLHYIEVPGEEWKSVKIPTELEKWFKLSHCCFNNDLYHFPFGKNDEVGVVIGLGDSIVEAITNVCGYIKAVKKEPMFANTKEFMDLLVDIKKAQDSGNKFSDEEIPSPEEIIDLVT